ncbi:histidine kinase dimerization/phospho-acceptor domain-containing protein [Deinococcus malanensis]|uniref:histidine kinase dimerization/phospho-acceptor domain-containing protein n=1 Tax=Deinococcus malanensis TaxID=1706855 RepID=UPI00363F2EAA
MEALTPLGPLDRAVRDLRNLLFSLGAVSLIAVIGLGGSIAKRALAPVARLTSTAGDIAQSGDLSRRVGPVEHPDELGRLALTFNEMLGSLQASSQVQQRFLADASHELRAPLTIMQGNLELLRLHPDMDPQEKHEMLSDVEKETTRLARLVSDMLLLARRDAGVPFRAAPWTSPGLRLKPSGTPNAWRVGRSFRPPSHLVFVSAVIPTDSGNSF